MESGALELSEIECGVNRPRSGRAINGSAVFRGRDGRDRIPIAVREIENANGNLRPRLHRTGACKVVGAVRTRRARLDIIVAIAEQPKNSLRHVCGEREAADLVVHHGHLVEAVVRVGAAVGEARHGLHEVAAVADHPRAAQDVVRGARRHGEVSGRLGLPVDRQRAEGLVLVVDLPGAVEDVVGGDVHQRDAVLGAYLGEQRRAGRIGLPGGGAALTGLRPVDRGVGAAVDDGPVQRPVVAAVGRRVRHVEGVDVAEVEGARDPALLGERAHRAAQLAVAAGHERALGLHGGDVPQEGVAPVRVADLALIQRDGPVDGEVGVGEVHERVRLLLLEAPVGVHEVGVGGAVLERLVGVAHAPGHVDGHRGVEDGRVDLPVGRAPRAQVDPGAEHAAGRHRDELVPWLGVDAARGAPLLVEADVVLHPATVGDPEREHLLALPVLLEPAAGVAMDGEVDDPEAGDAGLGRPQLLLVLYGHAG